MNENWTYTADLTPFAQAYGNAGPERTLLVFYGIDTIANIVCGVLMACFIVTQFDMTDFCGPPSRLGQQPVSKVYVRRVWLPRISRWGR